MELFVLLVGMLLVALSLWLSFIATISIFRDDAPSKLQKIAQFVFVWVFPFFGALLAMHITWQHCEEAVPERFIPWPFQKLVTGKARNPNRNREDREVEGVAGNIYRRNKSGDDEAIDGGVD